MGAVGANLLSEPARVEHLRAFGRAVVGRARVLQCRPGDFSAWSEPMAYVSDAP